MAKEAEPEVGRIVDGKYRLTRLIGRGGMGSVWEGVHTSLGTRFALKYIDVAFAGRKDVQARFANEALAAARLKSKHIVEVYDHGVDEHGCPYIVMEFLSGEPLDARLARDGKLSVTEAAELVVQVAKALSRAHAAGIIHRDLKPENLFLVWDDEDQKTVVKVVDFGIAKFSDGTGVDSATRTGAVLGTPHFMSPEQARGLKSVSFAADVWSLAVITYRAVTGRPPFDGEAVGDLLVKICTVEPVPPSELVSVPEGFDAWMARSLAKEPKDRFPSVAAQAEALAALVGGLDLGLSMLGPPASQGFVAPAVTVGSTSSERGRADTEGGLERPPTTPPARRWWWVLLPVAATAAGAFWVLWVDDTPQTDLPSPTLGLGSMSPASVSPQASPDAPRLDLPPSPPSTAAVAASASDAGPNRPVVAVSRPAGSTQADESETAEKSPPKRREPPPSAPRAPTRKPADELGY